MGDHDDRSALIVKHLKDREDLVGGHRIQVSGRLVRENEIRIVDQ